MCAVETTTDAGSREGKVSLEGSLKATSSPACANMTLLLRRVAHLAERSISEGPRLGEQHVSACWRVEVGKKVARCWRPHQPPRLIESSRVKPTLGRMVCRGVASKLPQGKEARISAAGGLVDFPSGNRYPSAANVDHLLPQTFLLETVEALCRESCGETRAGVSRWTGSPHCEIHWH